MTEQNKPEAADDDLTRPRKCISSFSPSADAEGADHARPPKGARIEKEPEPSGKDSNER